MSHCHINRVFILNGAVILNNTAIQNEYTIWLLNYKSGVDMKIQNFAQHDLIGILEICKNQIIQRPPEQMNTEGASYIG